ncbi:hypothetical protein PC9H_010004 [Pleurotus ostreatus]|uniref:DUF676 domain-containing protein n=1 Tax=Pleurotus ostreatus TaxID=5322 RepID=A0A8H7DR63_PLEOS|nr:uncharacterized protein PC9H_010004 [Pleurotus ostreatus]KAF7424693.1 hypothetical protein PC9H_010004 [Pleurotus ostreatus]KAJ8692316.1 hypothetical protein PTI98_009643 [Pleurotus ostreatus]
MSTSFLPVHLLVLIHGMWGHPSHLHQLVRRMEHKHPFSATNGTRLWVLNARTNSEELTYDGIDWGGERVVEEIDAEVRDITAGGGRVTRLSVTGYSLGGLIARYVVGILHQRGFFHDVEPINFNTIATPHIGMPRYASLLSALMAACAKHLSRTGEQLFCLDTWSTTGRSLLDVMADPDHIFYKALASFRHVRIYANAVNDVTVPYVTGAIELQDPFADTASSGVQIELDESYPPIISKYTLPPNPVKPPTLSRDWFRRFSPSSKGLFLPLQNIKLPLHKKIALYTLLPVLLALGVSFALRRFKRDSKTSRSRLRDLESDASRSRRLVYIFEQLEHRAEDVVIDVLEGVRQSGSDGVVSSAVPPQGVETSQNTTINGVSELTSSNTALAAHSAVSPSLPLPDRPQLRRTIDQPKLTDVQRRMVEQLNRLPLIKTLAYFHEARNAHALIVCRDADYFPEMRAGKNVVKYWSNVFVV